jgi:predicted DNA binding CopG/RHH family protein
MQIPQSDNSTSGTEGIELMAKAEQEHPTTKSRIPHFASAEKAAEFWDTHSTTEFEDEFEPAQGVKFVVTRGEPKKALTVRLPESTVAALTREASEKGIGPSTLVRMWILEHLRQPQQR